MRHSIPSSDDMWFDLHNKFDLVIQVEILRSLFEKFFALICGLQILGTRVEITNFKAILCRRKVLENNFSWSLFG